MLYVFRYGFRTWVHFLGNRRDDCSPYAHQDCPEEDFGRHLGPRVRSQRRLM
jgi:hypothetical protein